MPLMLDWGLRFSLQPSWSKWQNIDADDLPAAVKKSFDVMVEAEAAFKANLEKLLKKEGHMLEDKFLVMSRKGKRLGVAYASTPRGEGGAGSLKLPARCRNRRRDRPLASRSQSSLLSAYFWRCSTCICMRRSCYGLGAYSFGATLFHTRRSWVLYRISGISRTRSAHCAQTARPL